MAQDLAKIEPIPLPDVQRPAKLTLLPEWAEVLCATLKTETQRDRFGKYRVIAFLPREMMPSKTHCGLITNHAAALDKVLAMTPESDFRHAEQTVTAISKMMLTLPSREAGDLAAEAKSEAYMAALDDVPCWAVQEAMRRWYRGECGAKHDYRWQPAPATLRELALVETYRVRAVRRKMSQLLTAEPLIEFDEGHCQRMREKIQSLGLSLPRT